MARSTKIALCAAFAVVSVQAALAFPAVAQPARGALGDTPWVNLESEPPPKLFVDPPLPEALSRGVLIVQYRAEHMRFAPFVGEEAAKLSPRVGHLHITVDSTPWHWAEANEHNTLIVADLPPGRHQVLLELADATHNVLDAQTVKFVVPDTHAHAH
jgi:hypothetical protein